VVPQNIQTAAFKTFSLRDFLILLGELIGMYDQDTKAKGGALNQLQVAGSRCNQDEMLALLTIWDMHPMLDTQRNKVIDLCLRTELEQ